MSARLAALVPSAETGLIRWRRIAADGSFDGAGDLAAGETLTPVEGEQVVAVVPGDVVAVHWIELPEASPVQAAAAARLMARELIAGPAADQHVAAASEAGADGMRAIAVVAETIMRDWLSRLAASGIDPHLLIPAPMLLPVDEAGVVALRQGGQVLLRGRHLAAQMEQELADMVTAGDGARPVHRDLLDLALAPLSAEALLDLRQGEFARARKARIDPVKARRMAGFALAIAALALLVTIVDAARYTVAADRLERDIQAAARAALPDAVPIVNPRARLRERLAATGASGSGFVNAAAALFAALQSSGIRLESLNYDPAAGLRATVIAGTGTTLDTLAERLAASGYVLVQGASRGAAEGQRIDVEITPQ